LTSSFSLVNVLFAGEWSPIPFHWNLVHRASEDVVAKTCDWFSFSLACSSYNPLGPTLKRWFFFIKERDF